MRAEEPGRSSAGIAWFGEWEGALEEEAGLGAVVVHGEGLGGFGLGAADEEFDFGVGFEQVDGDDSAGDVVSRSAAAPDVDLGAVAGARVGEVAVGERIDAVRPLKVPAAARAVDRDLAACD